MGYPLEVKEDGSVVSWGHKEMGGRQMGCGSRLQQGLAVGGTDRGTSMVQPG